MTKVTVKQSTSGQWAWELFGLDGEPVQAGGGYENEDEALEAAYMARAEYLDSRRIETRADAFVDEVRGSKPREELGRQLQRSLKVYEDLWFQIEALALNSGKSRNAVANRMLAIGLETLASKLTDEEYRRLFTVPEAAASAARSEEEAA